MADTRLIWITEVHNFGGFFGGDTVTLSAVPWPDGDEETLTIDEQALANVRDRHNVAPQMLFEINQTGERVDRARLIAARHHDALREALGDAPSAPTLAAPQIRAYRCPHCDLWFDGAPDTEHATAICRLCRRPIA
jgi:hypothetical protein